MPCNKCSAINKNGERCKRIASCKIGCNQLCWQHSKNYISGEGCINVSEKDFINIMNTIEGEEVDIDDVFIKAAEIGNIGVMKYLENEVSATGLNRGAKSAKRSGKLKALKLIEQIKNKKLRRGKK